MRAMCSVENTFSASLAARRLARGRVAAHGVVRHHLGDPGGLHSCVLPLPLSPKNAHVPPGQSSHGAGKLAGRCHLQDKGEGQLRPPGPTFLEGDLQTPAEAHGVLEVPEAGQREGAPLLAWAGSGQSGPQGPGTAPRVGAPRVPSATVHPWSCELRLGFRSGGSALQRQPGCSVLVTFFFLMCKSIH